MQARLVVARARQHGHNRERLYEREREVDPDIFYGCGVMVCGKRKLLEAASRSTPTV